MAVHRSTATGGRTLHDRGAQRTVDLRRVGDKVKGMIDLVSDVNGYTGGYLPHRRTRGRIRQRQRRHARCLGDSQQMSSNAADAKTYTLDSKGYYTNLEVYANQLVEDIMRGGNANAETTVDEYYPAATTGIGKLSTAGASADNTTYNLAGQRVDGSYKGIVIRNGRSWCNDNRQTRYHIIQQKG